MLHCCKSEFEAEVLMIYPKKTVFSFLKVVSATFLLVCILSLNDRTCQTRKNVFSSLQKLFSLLRKWKFRILHFQISWRHQMPKQKHRNTFHWISWEVKHSLLMKFGLFMSHYKRKNFIKKFYKNCNLKTSSRPFYVCKELSTTSIGKLNSWSNLLVLDM